MKHMQIYILADLDHDVTQEKADGPITDSLVDAIEALLGYRCVVSIVLTDFDAAIDDIRYTKPLMHNDDPPAIWPICQHGMARGACPVCSPPS